MYQGKTFTEVNKIPIKAIEKATDFQLQSFHYNPASKQKAWILVRDAVLQDKVAEVRSYRQPEQMSEVTGIFLLSWKRTIDDAEKWMPKKVR